MSTNKPDTNASWGGRFGEATDAFVQEFTASVSLTNACSPKTSVAVVLTRVCWACKA